MDKVARTIKRLRKLPLWAAAMPCAVLGALRPDGRSRTTSLDLAHHPTLRALLGYAPPFHSRLLPVRGGAFIGWGRKWSGRRAVAVAAGAGAEFRLLEDGFLRSVGRGDRTLSIVFDDVGIYYDSTAPSRLERLIAAPLEPAEEVRATRLIAEWRRLRLSKYNAAREPEGALPESYVLVADQVTGDLSIGYGLAGPEAFLRMLDAALAENPGKAVVVKLHPDALDRGGRSHFDAAALAAMPRVRVIAQNCHPARLIEGAEAVYTVTSQIGFEALIWGKRVRCFGMPFYAGWGLTGDDLPPPARRGRASHAQLVHAALVAYPRYLHPESGTPCEVEEVMTHVGLQRRMRQRFPEVVHATGFSRRKRPILRRFLQGSEVRFVRAAADVPEGGALALWGSAPATGVKPGVGVFRVEDGFIRSAGLGADLTTPLSWVVDGEGLYYDASAASRIETLLQTATFDPAMIDRARHLRAVLIRQGVTKYNLNGPGWRRPDGAARVILVPGQVENDASIRLGAGEVRTNTELLRRVRAACLGAHIVFKPHPDVVAGLRRAGDGDIAHADEIVTACDTAGLIGQVDEVHTITSLLGFEALLRGVPVTCYGRPFYAGWGLTTDLCPIPRRTRRLDLDDLVAGALIDYPTYVSGRSGAFTTPEAVVEELVAWRAGGPSRMAFGRRLLRGALRAWAASGLRSNA